MFPQSDFPSSDVWLWTYLLHGLTWSHQSEKMFDLMEKGINLLQCLYFIPWFTPLDQSGNTVGKMTGWAGQGAETRSPFYNYLQNNFSL